MKILRLGVVDLPYSENASYKGLKRRRPKKVSVGAETTGDVAEILEGKYGVMATFFARHEQGIGQALAEGLAGTLESVMQGAPTPGNPFAAAESAIDTMFREALTNREFDGLIKGVPTRAAQEGVSRRFKKGRGPKDRPSFIDTGLYEASFKAEVVE